MKRSIFTIIIFAIMSIKANAAVISVGGFNINDYQFADSVVLVSGTAPKPASNAQGFNFNSFITIDQTDMLSIGFTDNVLFNGTGIDILIFELAGVVENSLLSLTMGGSQVSGTFLGTDNTLGTTFQINIFGFDLSDFGVGAGQFVLSNLFLSPLSNDPDIAAIAAINSLSSEEVNSVPVPAPVGFMGLMLIALVLRSRKSFF